MNDPTDNHPATPTDVRRFWISEPEQSAMRDHDGQHCNVVREYQDDDAGKYLVRFADGFAGIAFADELHPRGANRP